MRNKYADSQVVIAVSHQTVEKLSSLEALMKELAYTVNVSLKDMCTGLISMQNNIDASIDRFIEESQKIDERLSIKFEQYAEENRKTYERLSQKMDLNDERANNKFEQYAEENRKIDERLSIKFEQYAEENRKTYERLSTKLDQNDERTTKKFEQYVEENQKIYERLSTKLDQNDERATKKFEQYVEENRKDDKKLKDSLNKQKAELSDSMGRLAEDFAAPNIPFIAVKYFGCVAEDYIDYMVRRRRVHKELGKEKKKEFDLVFVYPGLIFLNETKFSGKSSDVDKFAESITTFFDYFPEFVGLRLIPIFASFYIDESVINRCTKKGIYCMSLSVETMDLLNYEKVTAAGDKRPKKQ